MNTDRTILGHHQRDGEVLPGLAMQADLTREIERLAAENDRLNRLVGTLSRALTRYQDEAAASAPCPLGHGQ